MTILSRPNSIVSDCSSLGQLDDVTPFTSFEADPLNLGFQTKQCSFGSLNVNSLLGQDRLHQIELILKSNNFSALALQETKICPSTSESCFSVPGYVTYFRHRNRFGGGTMIIIRSDIPSRQLPDLENSTPELEHTAAELFIQGKRIVFSSMYRPPSCCKDTFKNSLSCTLDKITQNAPALTIIGSDMNFGNNFEFYGSLKTTPFDFEATSILQQSCLNQIIDRSTHFAKTTNGHTASLLDHIWIDRVDLVTKAVVFSPISDHCGTGAVLDLLSPKPKEKPYKSIVSLK